MLNVDKIRQDFPILAKEVYGKPLVYLDNAATTQKPVQVIRKIEEVYTSMNANIHRGVHYLSQQATEAHENARKTVQSFIHASSSDEVIFTRGTTEAINLVASSFCRHYCKPGDEIILSVMEHHSNIVPWQLQEEISGVRIKVIPITDRGELQIGALEQLITSRTRLIAIAHVSNVLGTINPVETIIDMAHRKGIAVLVDAAQSAPHIPIHVQSMDCDFLVFSAHKLYGPTGVGVLYGKRRWLEEMPPYQGGGEMIASVTFEKTTFNELPFKFEAGTPDYVGSVAFAEAIRYIQQVGLPQIRDYEEELLHYATNRLMQVDGVRIFGTSVHKSSVISFLVGNIHHYDMGMLLDRLGLAVRTGHHCAQPLMHHLGVEGTIRASFSFYNTKEEIDRLADGIKQVAKMF
jgi:cysteine desulfurase/selenocysteine lyase